MKEKELPPSWLIQRLKKPFNNPSIMDNMFSFGGGLKNGGLSEDAMKLLRPIFRFDYMGSAEFEFGAIPQFFTALAENIGSYSTFNTTINNTVVYVIGQTDLQKQIIKRLNELAKNRIRLKDYSDFNYAVGYSDWMNKECDTIGWLELDNTFLFFTDRTAFEKTVNLFGMKPNNEQEPELSVATKMPNVPDADNQSKKTRMTKRVPNDDHQKHFKK